MTTLKLTFGAVTDRGLNPRRTANEDRYLALPEGGLFLVADGVGGRRGGQVASQTVVDIFTAAFADRPRGEILPLVKQTIRRCNESIIAASRELAELEGMATTLAMVAIDGQRAVIAHVGDSRVYRFDGRQLVSETEDHSDVGDAMRAGAISQAQAAHHPQRNIINRALGAEAEVEPDIKVITLDARTSFLLCSDGVTRHLNDHELEDLLRGGAHPQNTCAELKARCFERGAEDNLTAVIVDCGERVYTEEATRPALLRSAAATTAASASRISVDFSPQEAATESKSMKNPPPADRSVRPQRGLFRSLFSGLLQLLFLGALLALAFLAGRHWDFLSGWVIGKGATPPAVVVSDETRQAAPELASARVLFEERRYDKARDRFTELVRQNPANTEYRYWLGRTQLELKQPQEAIKNLNEAARLDDKLPNIFVHLALAYDAAGDRRNSTESLRRALTPVSVPTPQPSPAQ